MQLILKNKQRTARVTQTAFRFNRMTSELPASWKNRLFVRLHVCLAELTVLAAFGVIRNSVHTVVFVVSAALTHGAFGAFLRLPKEKKCGTRVFR